MVPRQYMPGHAASLTAESAMTDDSVVSSLAEKWSVPVWAHWLRTWGLHLEFLLAVGAGLGAAVLADASMPIALAALGAWVAGSYHRGRAVTTPLGRQIRTAVDSAVLPLALLALAVAFAGVEPTHLPGAVAAVGSATAVATLCRSLRWRLQSPVRLVVVGDATAVATAAARWAGTPGVRVVGGLLSDPEAHEGAVPHDILGVAIRTGLDDAQQHIADWKADLVVVAPSAGVTPEVFRRLTWSLEGTRTAVGLSGVLEPVASHRIAPGGLGRSSIIDVRAPRPSRFVRGAKAAFDRVVGTMLLVVAAPILLGMAVAVRLDSKGPALFSQTRVGLNGRHFQVLKMRTMVVDADARKADLMEANEADSVLFKMRQDPRVTRVGAFLRKSSLDELPQLINVVKGEMSLVGPRPHLPSEIAEMDHDTLRRLAVRPGITGLWQVSGRSDLSWREAAALDTYYADNWTFTGDLIIGLRTVKAVLGAKGAY